jgi:hypothetical protein
VGIIQKDLAGRVSPGRALAEKTGESPAEDSFLEAGKIGEAVHHIVVSAFQ